MLFLLNFFPFLLWDTTSIWSNIDHIAISNLWSVGGRNNEAHSSQKSECICKFSWLFICGLYDFIIILSEVCRTFLSYKWKKTGFSFFFFLNKQVYQGVNRQGFVQPRMLASQDIVVTTYETLCKELDYVDLPHTNSKLI